MSPEELLTHARWVQGLARALILDASQIDDVVQTTWLEALKRPPQPEINLRAWLGGVLRNVVRQKHRADTRRTLREQKSAKVERLPSTEELVEKADLQKTLVEALMRLEEPHRSTLLLRYMEELSTNEIAARLQVPSSTVRNRVRRALIRLRQDLEFRYGHSDRTFSLSLIPLALPHRSLEATALSSGVTSGFTGAISMIFSSKISLLVFLLLGGGAFLVNLSASTPDAPPNKPQAYVAHLDDPEENSESPEPTLLAQTPIDPKMPEQSNLTRVRHLVSGQVLDVDGKPIPGAKVFVGSYPNPFTGKPDGDRVGIGAAETKDGTIFGKTLETDSLGKYEAEFSTAKTVYVTLLASPGVRPGPMESNQHPTPATDVDFTAKTIPTGNVRLSARDLSTGERLSEFRYVVKKDGRFLMQGKVLRKQVNPGIAALTLEVENSGGQAYRFELDQASLGNPSSSIVLAPGDDIFLEIQAQSGDGVTGTVIDPLGQPVESALVFFGNEIRMRGDEPFKPYDEKRILDGVRTDSSGGFSLRGKGREITVWHPELSPVTAPLDEATSITMSPRGSIRGRLLDDHGKPLAHQKMAIDRNISFQTDEDGRFFVTNIAAGIRGLFVTKKDMFSILVLPGETTELEEFLPLPEVRIDGFSTNGIFEKPLRGVLVGETYPSSFREFHMTDGSGTASRIIPGNYLFLARTGHIARIQVEGTAVETSLGNADLTVHGKPDTRIYVVPHGSNEFIRLMAGRVASQTIPSSGRVMISPLPEGIYDVGIDRLGIFTTVHIKGRGTEVTVGTE